MSLVATASLADLATGLRGAPLDPARFRANLVVETDVAWLEDTWAGRDVAIGDAVLRVVGPIPRCAVVDLDPATGVRDRPVLHTLAALRPDAGPTGWASAWTPPWSGPASSAPATRCASA